MISSRRRYFTKVRSAESLRATDERALPALFRSARCERTDVHVEIGRRQRRHLLAGLARDPGEVLRDVALVGAHGVRRDVAIEFEIGEEGLQMLAHASIRRGQARDPVRKCRRHCLWALGEQRVTRICNHDDRHAIAEFVLDLLTRGLGPERVTIGLQIQQRRDASRPPLLLRDGGSRGALRLAEVRMPTGQPDASIAGRGKEGLA